MGTFTIDQTQESKNLYLCPNANGCNIDLTPNGAATNWQCVDDPRIAPDDDTTYVSWDLPATGYDLYELPDHTTESGTINYVQVFNRGKVSINPLHENGTYKIILTENACSNIYKSNNLNILLNNYASFNELWTVNPRTTAAWTWADIDNLEIGVEGSSPTVTLSYDTLTLRPNGTGANTNLSPFPVYRNNWDCVDEETPNDSDYVTTGAIGAFVDTYATQDHTTETGPITKVVVFVRGKTTGDSGDLTPTIEAALKSGAAIYYSTPEKLSTTWTYYSYEWLLNPDDSAAWEWSDIDNMEIGVRIKRFTGVYLNYCSHIYAVVYYESTTNPEIRTTQCYAKINYSEEVQCVVQKPDEISVDHARNTKMLNFWSGNRAVYDLTRSKKSMVMTGIFRSTTACDDVECIRGMAENGSEITIAGLTGAEYNSTFRIKSFGTKKIQENPLTFRWILECEFSE